MSNFERARRELKHALYLHVAPRDPDLFNNPADEFLPLIWRQTRNDRCNATRDSIDVQVEILLRAERMKFTLNLPSLVAELEQFFSEQLALSGEVGIQHRVGRASFAFAQPLSPLLEL